MTPSAKNEAGLESIGASERSFKPSSMSLQVTLDGMDHVCIAVRRWHRPGVTAAEVRTPQTYLSLNCTAYAPVSALMKSCVKGFARTLSSFGTSSLRWGVVMWTSSAALSVHLSKVRKRSGSE